MAYGLKIDNGNGQRVIDSDYNGTYYLGKTTVPTGGATVSVPGYSSDIPPLAFVKLPTSGYASVTSIENATGDAPGGSSDFTVSAPSNLRWIYWKTGSPYSTSGRHATSGECSTEGGYYTGGICYRTADLDIAVDTYSAGYTLGSSSNPEGNGYTWHSNGSVSVGDTTIAIQTTFGSTPSDLPRNGEGVFAANQTFNSITYPTLWPKYTWTGVSGATLTGVKWWDSDGNPVTSGTTYSNATGGHTRGRTYQTGRATVSFNSTGSVTGATVRNASFGMNPSSSADAPHSINGCNFITISDDMTTKSTSGSGYSVVGGRQPTTLTNGEGSGWFPYDTNTSGWPVGDSTHLTASVNSLNEGWIVNVDASTSTDVYLFGVGGDGFGTDDQGLELFDSDGNVTFSTRRPTANIADIQTVDINNIKYISGETDNTFSGSGTVSGSLPASTTAVSLMPVLTPTVIRLVSTFTGQFHGGTGFPMFQISPETRSFGLNYGTSGSNVSSLNIGASTPVTQGSTLTAHAGICSTIDYAVQPPVWEGTETGGGAMADIYATENPLNTSSPDWLNVSWDVSGQVVFLDTSVYDRTEFNNLVF